MPDGRHWPRQLGVGALAAAAFFTGSLVAVGLPQDLNGNEPFPPHAPPMVASAGPAGSGASNLYVIDTDKRCLVVYRADGARGIKFVSARKIKYDLYLREFRDRSEGKTRVRVLAELWRRQMLGRDDDEPKRRRR